MMSRQIAQRSLRQGQLWSRYNCDGLGLTRAPVVAQQSAFRFASPAAIALGTAFSAQHRLAATLTATSEVKSRGGTSILEQQRLNRPVSPHLGIYKPQITWYLSILNRITGVILSGGFYIYGALYLVAPYLGWHVESSVLAAGFAAWPLALKFATKFAIALPFTFHSFNGLRHLMWDTANMMTNKQVNSTGWFVVGLTALSSLGLAMW